MGLVRLQGLCWGAETRQGRSPDNAHPDLGKILVLAELQKAEKQVSGFLSVVLLW